MLTRIFSLPPSVFAFLAGAIVSLSLNLIVAVKLREPSSSLDPLLLYATAILQLIAALLLVYISTILEEVRGKASEFSSPPKPKDLHELLRQRRSQLFASIAAAAMLLGISFVLLFRI